jgi:glutathione peroxidase
MSSLKIAMADAATTLTRVVSRALGLAQGTTRVKPLAQSFYSITAPAIDGTPVDFARYAGNVSLVVNVASECGFTPQYEGLQRMHQELASRGFVVLGFPSNEFGGQEPGTAEEIRAFCDTRYHVTFPMFGKVETKPGPGQSQVYRRLGESGRLPSWNFYKYLVGRDGHVKAVFPTNVPPDAPELRAAIERELQQHANRRV